MHWPIWRAKVTERSMEPALRPGDCLLIRRTRRIRPGQVVVARHPEQPEMLIVKRAARRADGGWWLESDNPAAGCWVQRGSDWRAMSVVAAQGSPSALYIYGLVPTPGGMLAVGIGRDGTTVDAATWTLKVPPV